MTTAVSKKLIVAICFLLLLHFTCFSAALAQHLSAPPAKTNLHPKISSYLKRLEQKYKEGANADQLVPQGVGISSPAPGRVAVYLMSAPGTRIDETALSDMGAEITKRYGNVIRAQVPIDRLTDVADTVSGISFMRAPDILIPTAVESEGVHLTGADSYHTAGFDGTGVKVAVIDVGFEYLSDAINSNELPGNVVKVDCTGASCVPSDFSSETDSHGTAVAEIVHEMAPGALLYLIKISDILDLEYAENYVKNNNIRIINHSLVIPNTNFYDGKCWSPGGLSNADCTADDAYDHNILWVNAAGNEAQSHYEAVFSDPDKDGWHNVSGTNEYIDIAANAGDTIEIYLTWDAWNATYTTDQDFDLYLYDNSNVLVDSSTNTQAGAPLQLPTERIVYVVPAASNGPYHIAIYRQSATSEQHKLELYSINQNLTPAVAAGSLLSPADATGAFAVGAIDYNYWTTGPEESYSSQGPTNDNRIKPDIMGPDFVSNSIEGIFAGTSASSPHVAGAAALILQKNPGISVDQLRESLTSTAFAMKNSSDDPVPNNVYGYGRMNLDIHAAVPSASSGTSGGSGGGGGGGCFIATAAYGSYEAPYVLILRKMRDRFLVTNAPGKAFVHLYYTYSPPITDIIADHNSLKIAVRIGLLPLVGISWLALKTGPLFTLSLAALFVFGLIRLVSKGKFRRRKLLARRTRSC
jgi:subtilisin family serine protease